jgi:hypothetical protein
MLLSVLKPAILETDLHLSQLPQSLSEIINQYRYLEGDGNTRWQVPHDAQEIDAAFTSIVSLNAGHPIQGRRRPKRLHGPESSKTLKSYPAFSKRVTKFSRHS